MFDTERLRTHFDASILKPSGETGALPLYLSQPVKSSSESFAGGAGPAMALTESHRPQSSDALHSLALSFLSFRVAFAKGLEVDL